MTRRRAMDGVLGPALFMLLGYLLRASAFAHLSIEGVTPQLVLVAVVLTALRQGAWRAAWIGFIGGFCEDLIVGRFIGLHAISLWLVGYFVGLLRRRLYPDPWFVPALALLIGFAVNESVLLSALLMTHLHLSASPALLLIELAYTMPFAYMFRPVFHRPEAPR